MAQIPPPHYQLQWQKFLSLLRRCPCCGHSIGQIDLYCESCWTVIWDSYKNHPSPIPVNDQNEKNQFFAYPIFKWEPNQFLLIDLIYRLKNGAHPLAWDRLARRFQISWHITNTAMGPMGSKSESFIFVPAPPKFNYKKDHAYFFAQALARIFDGQVFTCLERTKTGKTLNSTRSLSRLERANEVSIRLKPNVDFRPFKRSNVVFVDDIVTTGATARQAYACLGFPGNFKVWALAFRAKDSVFISKNDPDQ